MVQTQTRVLWEGSVEGESRSQTASPNAMSSVGRTWPHQVQDVSQPLHFPHRKLNLNYLPINHPWSVCWVITMCSESSCSVKCPLRAELEGEGTAAWEGSPGWGHGLEFP